MMFCVECWVVGVLSSLEARLRLVQRYRGYWGRPSSGAKRGGLGATKQHMPGWPRGLHQDATPCGQKGAGLQPGSLERRLGTGPGVPCHASCHRGLCPCLPGCFLPPSQSLGSVLAPRKKDVMEPCSSWRRLSCVRRGEQSGGDPSTRQGTRSLGKIETEAVSKGGEAVAGREKRCLHAPCTLCGVLVRMLQDRRHKSPP